MRVAYVCGWNRGAAWREAIVREERDRIARELHDVLGQGLTGMLMHADAALQDGHPQRTRDALHFVKRLARQTLIDSKRVLLELRPHALENGLLPEALRRMLGVLTEGLPVTAHLTVDGVPRAMRSAETERHLFRIAQEAVTNALRHSGARRIDVVLRFDPSFVGLFVRDDGGGSGAFSRDELPSASSGLRGMRERANSIGAHLTVQQKPGGGTEITVQVEA